MKLPELKFWAFFGIIWSTTFVSASIVDDIIDAPENAVDCASCHSLLAALQDPARRGDSIFSDIYICAQDHECMDKICIALLVQDDDVCEGMISRQGPIVAHDLREIKSSGQTATKLCAALLGLCQPPDINPFTVSFPRLTPLHPKKFISRGRTPFQVVHFSGVHIDRQYTVTRSQVCCRNYPDHTGPIITPAGPFGSRLCDTPTPLIHESSPVDAFPRNTTDGISNQWLFDAENEGWSEWLDSVALDQVIHMSGSYSRVVPGTNLRIISLNDIYWYKHNFWLYDDDEQQPDPNGILAFTRVWIIAHVPLGHSDALYDQSNCFNQIVQRYHNTIAGQFYGHTHKDRFAVGYSDYAHQSAATANSIGWIAPSITPREANSAFKVYDVDPDTYEIMDAKVFVSDLADPTFQTNRLRAKESLNPAFWHKVTEAFATNDTAFQMYRMFEKRGTGVTACDADCKTGVICQLRALRSKNNCV
ncbi:hypothetical protein AMATHDRAFT_81654 [Amanita thiersii Skay4041]|uniref:Saposin B-type domain-containing protein n=1 Tax=Amanita thiersii Skay4041 TaxID=703135 RepID=A0A2A9NLR6_9AGAR|nr:hypothetical protein AMATHDRAFT_81654 [Amanita thiersii Skay4041]